MLWCFAFYYKKKTSKYVCRVFQNDLPFLKLREYILNVDGFVFAFGTQKQILFHKIYTSDYFEVISLKWLRWDGAYSPRIASARDSHNGKMPRCTQMCPFFWFEHRNEHHRTFCLYVDIIYLILRPLDTARKMTLLSSACVVEPCPIKSTCYFTFYHSLWI